MTSDRASAPFLSVQQVNKGYGPDPNTSTQVCKNVSFTLKKGSFNVFYGASGCGKTTLLNLIGGMDRPDSGEIIVDGSRVSHMSTPELTLFRREKVGFVFQFFNLLPTLTAAENIEAGLEYQALGSKERRQRAATYLRLVGLAGAEDKLPAELSGGQQQRVGIGRALAKQPSIILADEPTGNLDDYNTDQIIALLVRIWKENGITLLIATHNAKFVEHAQQIFHISNGTVIPA